MCYACVLCGVVVWSVVMCVDVGVLCFVSLWCALCDAFGCWFVVVFGLVCLGLCCLFLLWLFHHGLLSVCV